MAVYSITLDLRTPDRSYDELYRAIEYLGDYIHPIDANWFVATNAYNAQSMCDALQAYVDKNDSIFINKISSAHQGWMKKDFWSWLNENI